MFPNPPFKEKKVGTGFLRLGKSGVELSVKHPKVPRINVLIPYDEIFDATFVPATKLFKGFLCVREKENRHIPLPRNRWERLLRDTYISFEWWDNVVFYQAYEFLKQCVQINNKEKSNE